MRLCLQLQSESGLAVPFDYQHELVRTFHRWLPENDIHDDISLYSLSWLNGGKAEDGKLKFPRGASWFISFYDERIAKHLLAGILRLTETTFGMRVIDVQILEAPNFGDSARFALASPALVKHYDGANMRHLTFGDTLADEIMTATMQSKMQKAGIKGPISIHFDRSYANAKTKMVNIKGICNRASMCPVIVEGAPEAISFAWSVGIGHSTGAGFGAVC